MRPGELGYRTGWFAMQSDDENECPGKWQPALQIPGLIIPAEVWFDTEKDCLGFIRETILNRGMWPEL